MYKGTRYRRKVQMRRRRKKRITAFIIIFLLAAAGGAMVLCRPMLFGGFQKQSGRHIKNTALFKVNIEKLGYVPGKKEEPVRAEETLRFESEETEEYENDMLEAMERDTVKSISAKRVSPAEICIMWNGMPDDGDVEGGQYVIMRRGSSANVRSEKWEEIGAVEAFRKNADSGEESAYEYTFTDSLDSPDPAQYQYRIDVRTNDNVWYTGTEESMASNVLICIDPGHYKGASEASGENMYGYEEGIFTVRVGLALKGELEEHGIDSYLTRETDNITIAGYTNAALDRGHISLRGEYAAGSNLFLSIHTNANNDNANGCDTWQQPLAINKTLVIVNQTAGQSEQMLTVANEIGKAVTAANCRLGLSLTDQFERAGRDSVRPWTDEYNDSLNVKGTVCCRLGTDGDYYGVLRGAADAGVPGMIVEHGYHTVEEVRRQAMTENLAMEWARADAEGITKGLGFE